MSRSVSDTVPGPTDAGPMLEMNTRGRATKALTSGSASSEWWMSRSESRASVSSATVSGSSAPGIVNEDRRDSSSMTAPMKLAAMPRQDACARSFRPPVEICRWCRVPSLVGIPSCSASGSSDAGSMWAAPRRVRGTRSSRVRVACTGSVPGVSTSTSRRSALTTGPLSVPLKMSLAGRTGKGVPRSTSSDPTYSAACHSTAEPSASLMPPPSELISGWKVR